MILYLPLQLRFPALCCLSIVLSLFLPACAATHQTAVSVPVGPSPFETASGAPNGNLQVLSAWDAGMPGQTPRYVTYHSGYRIYSSDGKLLRYIHNRAGGAGYTTGDPALVGLAPGRYTVVAQEQNSGMVTVPVVIKAGKTTSVHLDGSKPALGSSTGGSDLVRLPDGIIVGWGAQDANIKGVNP